MPCKYSDPVVLRDLISRRLAPAERSELAAHLESDCPDCEAAIEAIGLDRFGELLANRADRMSPDRFNIGQEEMDAAFAHVAKRAGVTRRPGLVARLFGSRRPAIFAGAGTVMVAALAIVFLLPQRSSVDGQSQIAPLVPIGDKSGQTEKGMISVGTPPALTLWFEVGTIDAEARVIGRGTDGGAYPQDRYLVIHYQLDRAAYLYVMREDSLGHTELIYASEARTELADDGVLRIGDTPAAYPLRGLSGEQRIIAFASPRFLTKDEVLAGRVGEDVGRARFHITVAGGGR